jgi:hypothetical protein
MKLDPPGVSFKFMLCSAHPPRAPVVTLPLVVG